MVRTLPLLVSLEERNAARVRSARRLDLIAINVDRKRADAERFWRKSARNSPSCRMKSGLTPNAYSVTGMPSSYRIDVRSNVTFVERGFLDEQGGA